MLASRHAPVCMFESRQVTDGFTCSLTVSLHSKYAGSNALKTLVWVQNMKESSRFWT